MRSLLFSAGVAIILVVSMIVPACAVQEQAGYQNQDTKDLVKLVRDAASLIESKGEAAFSEFRKEGSAWRQGKNYIFVLDTDGNAIVHPDPMIEGKNQMALKDQDDKMIIKGMIDMVTYDPAKKEGWFHYRWPEPGNIFSSWKTTFVKSAASPSKKTYIVASGLYNMKIEKEFIVHIVDQASALIEKEGKAAFPKLRDKSSQFIFLDTYVFVDTPEGVELVNPAFPDLEGKNIIDYKDPAGKYLTRDLISMALKRGSGWVDYLWPKPGQDTPVKKHTYVKKAMYGGETFIVGSGAYIPGEEAVRLEKIAGNMMIIELKNGQKVSGKVTKETNDSIFLANPDGSMEVSFPRSKIANIRKPTDEEMVGIKENLAEKSGTQK